MIETLAVIFAGYAAYAGWPWWWAAIVGALCGFQVANARVYRAAGKERLAAGDPAISGTLFKVSIIGIAAGGAIAAVVYYAARWLIA